MEISHYTSLASPLLASQAPRRHAFSCAVVAGTVFAFVALPCLLLASTMRYNAALPTTALHAAHRSPARYWHGVSLGGWLVMEINPASRTPSSPPDVRPHWMFDQIEAASELDFISALRASRGDEFTTATMRNHWEGYIADSSLDAAAALGVDAVRIPLGYWIVDPPVGGSSPLEYGFTADGFASGGLNHLLSMLSRLHGRGIVAILDMHALPCNSACVSDGLSCEAPLAFGAPGKTAGAAVAPAPCSDIPRCDGGSYPTTRGADSAGCADGGWGGVALSAIASLAEWIARLPAKER